MIRVDRLSKRLGAVMAVDGIVLESAVGGTLTLPAATGAEEPTASRRRASVPRPTSGQASANGDDSSARSHAVCQQAVLLTEVLGLFHPGAP